MSTNNSRTGIDNLIWGTAFRDAIVDLLDHQWYGVLPAYEKTNGTEILEGKLEPHSRREISFKFTRGERDGLSGTGQDGLRARILLENVHAATGPIVLKGVGRLGDREAVQDYLQNLGELAAAAESVAKGHFEKRSGTWRSKNKQENAIFQCMSGTCTVDLRYVREHWSRPVLPKNGIQATFVVEVANDRLERYEKEFIARRGKPDDPELKALLLKGD